MKRIFLAILLIFLSGCSTKNEAIEQVKKNASKYKDLSNTQKVLTKGAIIYITLKKNKFVISINSRDREVDISLNSCKVNGKNSQIEPSSNAEPKFVEWLDSYEVYFNTKAEKLKLECQLSNHESFIKSFSI